MGEGKGPFLTANHVTLLRIALLPVPCALVLYASREWLWTAVVLFVALGFTDLLDGWMARKWGASVLGALLDPVADKVFMASSLIPMILLGLVHPAVVVVIMLREFLITSLRSAMSLRGRHVKTKVLAKLKTAVQMTAIPFLLFDGHLLGLVDTHVWGTWLIWISAVLTVWSMVYYLQKALPEIRARSR